MMPSAIYRPIHTNNDKGAVVVLVAILIFVLFGMAAFAVDIGHLAVVKNELQNAADAGALAGTLDLYIDGGKTINIMANQIAEDAAENNLGQKTPVEVEYGDGDGNGVKRGHWNPIAKTFTPNDSIDVLNLLDYSTQELYEDPNFINAIRVITKRKSTPVVSFFGRIFGRQSYEATAVAVAFLGFAGGVSTGQVDLPIAICWESIINETDAYDCSVGRMINSGQDPASNDGQSGGWTDFNQDTDPSCCLGGTNAADIKPLVECDQIGSGVNPFDLKPRSMATSGGQVSSAFNKMLACWDNNTPPKPWNVRLPVVTCPSNNVGVCETVVGYVKLEIVWISGTDSQYRDVPKTETYFTCSNPDDGEICWDEFTSQYNLLNLDNTTAATYQNFTIYFKPVCDYSEIIGGPGGLNLGILAKLPVLVD